MLAGNIKARHVMKYVEWMKGKWAREIMLGREKEKSERGKGADRKKKKIGLMKKRQVIENGRGKGYE